MVYLDFRKTETLPENKFDKLSKYTSIIDFLQLYSGTPTVVSQKQCIIHHGNKYKIVFDLWILVLLLIVSLIVPVRLAFAEKDSNDWFIFYIITDTFFFIDIVLTFFTSVTDEKKVYEITDKKVIAKKYLKGWFWVDLISILPIDILMKSDEQ